MSGLHWEPRDAASRIADAGMLAMESQAERERVQLGDTIIALSVVDPPVGEQNATVHAHMERDVEPDATTVLAVLCAKAQDIAEQEGIALEMTVGGVRRG